MGGRVMGGEKEPNPIPTNRTEASIANRRRRRRRRQPPTAAALTSSRRNSSYWTRSSARLSAMVGGRGGGGSMLPSFVCLMRERKGKGRGDTACPGGVLLRLLFAVSCSLFAVCCLLFAAAAVLGDLRFDREGAVDRLGLGRVWVWGMKGG